MDDAWNSFWTDFDRARATIFGSSLYSINDDTRTGANLLLNQLLFVGHFFSMQPNQMYPTFYGNIFQGPAHNTWGLPSPDNNFGLAFLDGQQTYRLRGRRNSVYKVWMVVYHGFWGDENPMQMAEMQLDDFEINSDGTFEIIVSAKRHEGNWIEMDGSSRNVPIMLRQNHLDWEKEQQAEFRIERVDQNEVRHNPILGEAEVAHRIRTAGRMMVHVAKMSCFTDWLVLKSTKGAFNQFVELNGPEISKYGTFNRAHYFNSVYKIGPEEALIITVDQPKDNEFWNVHIGDVWYQLEDFVYHQTSLNQAQARRDADGLYRIVIAHSDPGVANWLETSGREVGVLVWRVYGPRGKIAMPTIKRVALADLNRNIPASTARLDSSQRAEQLRRRIEAGRRRWNV